jgi:hypothetical protein
MFDVEREVLNLQAELESRTYKPGEYRTFTIIDPKPRTISASPFRDRVVHHALCAALDPVFERYHIFDCHACRVGKGTVAAIRRAQHFARKFRYFAKLDVRHFFETADHQVLKHLVRRLVKDEGVLWLVDLFIDLGAPGSPQGKGLPIGNLTSQNFANLYLGPFDHFIKEDMHIRGYVRYMDDVLMFDNDWHRLREVTTEAACFMADIKLELKLEVCRRAPVADGIPFLGFNIYPQLIRFDHCRKRRFARKLKEIGNQLAHSELDVESSTAKLDSMFGWAGIGNTVAYTRTLRNCLPDDV